jgi:uroporphyrin-III C-methyltransferase/precorrin-2 dehydrogenase/sirohydrochlorin ferrochelatase
VDYFPVFMDLRGQEVLVVGGGTVAERKIRLLLKARAKVGVVAVSLSENVRIWKDSGQIQHRSSNYDSTQLAGQRLVFAATNDKVLNRQVFHDAEAKGVPVNVVDDTDYCRFISPAVVDRSPVQVAISTGGASPVLARLLRVQIERLLPQGLGRVTAALRDMREEAKRRLPLEARRRFWESLLDWNRLQRWSANTGTAVRGQVRLALEQGKGQARQGMVYLVGAGPGNPDLLTLRAQDVLSSADVILHDRLVSEDILDLARRDADRIYVGKEAGNHHRQQDEIHRIMLAEAARGRTVVRLKGGDAFVFGRGGEELEVLRKAGVPYEVVPGVTAAMGCAAYAGIPLTHRDHAQSLTFITGHQAPGKARNGPGPDWRHIAGDGRTVVVYMGIGQAISIRQGLLDVGISPELPVALIEDGSRDSQRVLHGTVNGLADLAVRARKGRPGLLVIGQVASLGGTLGWFQRLHTIKNAA